MSHRHRHWPDGQQKTVEELLSDIIWQGAVQVYYLKVLAEQGAQEVATLDEVLAQVSAIEGDTANVERVITELSGQITALTDQVAALQAQIDAGTAVSAADLQGIADRLAAADASLDSLAPEAPAP